MEEVFRSLVGRFNESVRGYLKPRRRGVSLPIQISIQPDTQIIVVNEELAENGHRKKRSYSIAGETSDISESGLSFIVPSIRLGGHYLVSEGLVLDLEIDLPNGKLKLKAAGCRYEQLGVGASVGNFVVGVRIVEMSENDRVLLKEYLESRKGVRKNKVESVQWGLDLSSN